jgi:hypothetical protein
VNIDRVVYDKHALWSALFLAGPNERTLPGVTRLTKYNRSRTADTMINCLTVFKTGGRSPSLALQGEELLNCTACFLLKALFEIRNFLFE